MGARFTKAHWKCNSATKNWGIETANDLTPFADRKQVLIVILIVLEKFLKE